MIDAKLSPREEQIAKLAYKDGLTDKAIAEMLFLEICTVKTHIKNIRYKLGIKGYISQQPNHRGALMKALAEYFGETNVSKETEKFKAEIHDLDRDSLIGLTFFLYGQLRQQKLDESALVEVATDLYKHIQTNNLKGVKNDTLQRQNVQGSI